MNKQIKRIIKVTRTYLYQHPVYYSYYKKLKIQKNTILIESTHGRNLSGHLFYLLKELVEHYPHLTIYVAAQNVSQVKEVLGNSSVKVIKHCSRQYMVMLASAEYLLNDTSFYSFFIKKPGQKYFNFWHGTPLKTLGKDVESVTAGANVQRNFYMTDKIIISNSHTKQALAHSHGLNGVYQGQILLAPSPRNSILLHKQKRNSVRKFLNLQNQKVIFYMPTWRGTVTSVKNTGSKILEDLRYLSTGLAEDECLYVKLHPFEAGINLDEFPNISAMPNEYELYEFLTAVDLLITDYSSIMYDFLLTDRKIILYTYDKEEYLRTRGVYDQIDCYPFQQVNTVEALLQGIQDPNTEVEYQNMKSKFCPYDDVHGAKIVCDYLFNGQSHPKVESFSLNNGKETAMVFGGGLWDNGVTTALLNTFDNIDLTERNYILVLGQNKLMKEHMFRVRELSEAVLFYPIPETILAGILDRFLYLGYMRFEWFQNAWIKKRVAELIKIDFSRLVGDLNIDHFIHYTGFGNRYGELIKHVPNSVNTVMFVHTDMLKEYEVKKNFSKRIIFSAYQQVDKVAIVHENLIPNLVKAMPEIEDKIYVVSNFLGEQRIKQLAQANLVKTLESTTVEYGVANDELGPFNDLLGPEKSRLLEDLSNQNICCFINIGRYDYQKGHDRLILAFEDVYASNNTVRLIIVAPHGPLREETLKWVTDSSAREGIYVLGRMSNPYSLLKASDCFVLSSRYEGLGLVVYEALAIDTAVVTVNLTETVQYLKNQEVIIVDNSKEGIREGMFRYLASGGQNTYFDFTIPREKSLLEFEALFK